MTQAKDHGSHLLSHPGSCEEPKECGDPVVAAAHIRAQGPDDNNDGTLFYSTGCSSGATKARVLQNIAIASVKVSLPLYFRKKSLSGSLHVLKSFESGNLTG